MAIRLVPEEETDNREELLQKKAELEAAIAALDRREPEDMMGKAYETWADRHEALEDALDDIIDMLEALEE